MVPPRFPSGTYDLTLRSKQPDGKQATSKQSVAVAIKPGPADRPVVALMTPGKPTVVLSQPSAPKPMAGAVVVESVEIEPGGKFHASDRTQQPQLATALPGGGSPSTMVLPKIATTTVSRGDSLWRLSRLRYGVGTRYADIYKANREQIRNPNLIHPGQIFVLPAR
jgi:nucleoid-associated protein YgaU